MNTVNNLTTGNTLFGAGPASDKAKGGSALGKDDFLKLLLTQMQNQDPTAPADSQAFIAQLAQFSQVEQLQTANSNLDSLLLAQASSAQTSSAGLVGKDVTYRSDTLLLSNGQAASGSAQLQGDASGVVATITDASGHAVRTLQLGPHAAGAVSFSWDGKGDGGQQLPPGGYTVKVTATDAQGKPITVDQHASGRVTGVAFDAHGAPQLVVAGTKVPMGAITEIDQPTPGGTP